MPEQIHYYSSIRNPKTKRLRVFIVDHEQGVFVEDGCEATSTTLVGQGLVAKRVKPHFVWKSVWATQGRQRSEWRAVVDERHGWPAAIPPGSLPRVFSAAFHLSPLCIGQCSFLGNTSLPEAVLFLSTSSASLADVREHGAERKIEKSRYT